MSKSLTQMCADVITEKDRRIAELEKQLEEKDNKIQELLDYTITLKNGLNYQEYLKLQSKLHTQLLEIVEKIKDLAGDYFYENSKEDLLLTGSDFTEILDTVLKEYQ